MPHPQSRTAAYTQASGELPPRVRRVLVALDFSPWSLRALSRALRLPLAADARLELLHVLPPTLPGTMDGEAETLARVRMRRAAGVRRDLVPGLSHVTVGEHVRRGDAADAILRQARDVDAELIVLGRHGVPRGAGAVGSTAAAVSRRAPRPVLLVRNAPARPYRRPVVGLGLEDGSREALRLAALLAGAPRRVRAAHASDAPGGSFHHRAALPLGKARLRRSLEGVRRDLIRHLHSLGGVPTPIRLTVARGSPSEVVLGVARARRADLIALGVHGRRSALQRLLHGSVAEEVLRQAPCDVLIARPA